MYVYMYVYLHVCTYIYIYVHSYVYTYVYAYIYIHKYICVSQKVPRQPGNDEGVASMHADIQQQIRLARGYTSLARQADIVAHRLTSFEDHRRSAFFVKMPLGACWSVFATSEVLHSRIQSGRLSSQILAWGSFD